MTKSEYIQQTEALFSRWKRERPEYESEGNYFVHDGIANFDQWQCTRPKVLFLLKESYCARDEWEPNQGITSNTGRFSTNLARWHQILRLRFQDPSAVLSISNLVLPTTIEDIALVEIKKANQGRSTSSLNDIHRYAKRDKDFLKEQIEIIQPEVIVCCGTGDAYSAIIYGDESWEEQLSASQISLPTNSNSKRQCYKHRGRLVIDFYHPSPRGNDKDLFVMLCDMLQRGRVFEYFCWTKNK